MPAWLPVALVLLGAWAGFLAAAWRRADCPHARTWPRPRPHRLFMSGRHARSRRARHAA